MSFEVKVVEASVTEHGKAIHTLQLRYPRFIHSELMTHRDFSRNAASSRAIPVAKMIEQVRTNPAMPVHWGVNRPGMQAHEEMSDTMEAVQSWKRGARQAADLAEHMAAIGLHKQVANRILEPYQWMQTIVTATEWENFFALRCHPDAQPEFQKLAYMMRDAIQAAPLRFCYRGRQEARNWHLPYVTEREREIYPSFFLAKLSTARCARVSFLNHDGTEPVIDEDIKLFEKLIVSKPMHASPCEHQAFPAAAPDVRSGNFVGWFQHRKWLEGCATA